MKNFYSWLLTQTDRDDIVSDLASDIKRDSTFPKNSNEISEIREYLENKGACDGAIEALEEAWLEFRG